MMDFVSHVEAALREMMLSTVADVQDLITISIAR